MGLDGRYEISGFKPDITLEETISGVTPEQMARVIESLAGKGPFLPDISLGLKDVDIDTINLDDGIIQINVNGENTISSFLLVVFKRYLLIPNEEEKTTTMLIDVKLEGISLIFNPRLIEKYKKELERIFLELKKAIQTHRLDNLFKNEA